MTTLIGYSNRSDHFPYKLHGDALLAENLRIINEHAFHQAMARIDHPVNPNAWDISGVEFSMFYRQDANQIAVPAGSF
uniref:Uncharacterized protein n=1 Tax=Hyaloperonospora arabidopsidis (strain Emoy2) TaxID=559515 RepID=M4BTM7_HYAAE